MPQSTKEYTTRVRTPLTVDFPIHTLGFDLSDTPVKTSFYYRKQRAQIFI